MWRILVLLIGIVLIAGCGEAEDMDGAGRPTPIARDIVVAPIDELELIIRESFPPQYAVRILSGVPDGCTEFNEAKLTQRTGNTVEIEVTNTHPSDPTIACTAIYGTHESIVELGTDFASGAEYVVKVNDKELRFTAQ